MEAHPALHTVNYESMAEVMRCCYLMDAARATSAVLCDLLSLDLYNCPSSFHPCLSHATTSLPQLASLSLLQTDLTKQILDCVLQFSHLKKLELGNSSFTQYTVYFHEQIVPVLEHLGARLVSLTLEKFKFIDVDAIGEYCPKLHTLRLSQVLSFCNIESSGSKFPLLNLRRLSIFNTKNCRVTQATLKLLLSSQRITSLQLQGVDSLDDQLLTH